MDVSVVTTEAKVKDALRGCGYEFVSGELRSRKSVFTYKCPKGHSAKSSVDNFLTGKRCWDCAALARAAGCRLGLKDVAAVLACDGYVLLESEYVNNHTSMACRCPRGHVWRVCLNNFNLGRRCVVDSCGDGRIHGSTMPFAEAVVPILEAGYEILSGEVDFENTHSRVTLRCPQGHSPYEVQIYNFRNGRRCPGCACHSSTGERELRDFFVTLAPDAVSNRTALGVEVDALSSSLKLGLEYHGLYWHSEAAGKARRYHADKADAADAHGVKLLQFFEDEWRDKRPLVEALVTKAAGAVTLEKHHARALTWREVSVQERRGFFEANHLQGDARASVAWGLFAGEQLLQVLSLRKAGYTGGKPFWEIARTATKTGAQVVGGLSRLLAHAKPWLVARGVQQLFTFADRRYSQGKSYLAVGFTPLGKTSPGYAYTDFHSRRHRFALRKDKECPVGMGEREYRLAQGLHRIWDAGQLKFVLDLSTDHA